MVITPAIAMIVIRIQAARVLKHMSHIHVPTLSTVLDSTTILLDHLLAMFCPNHQPEMVQAMHPDMQPLLETSQSTQLPLTDVTSMQASHLIVIRILSPALSLQLPALHLVQLLPASSLSSQPTWALQTPRLYLIKPTLLSLANHAMALEFRYIK